MLELKNVSKSFSRDLDPVLKDVTLFIPEGEFCVVVGSNGSGKSTLLNAILGDVPINSGSVRLDGHNISGLSSQQRAAWISNVQQDTTVGTIPEMTLLENMVLSFLKGKKTSFQLYKNHKKFIADVVSELGLGLEAYLDTSLGSFSGGQRQMIATLMAVLHKPKILLLDEHTSALDPHTQKKLMKYTTDYIKKHRLTSVMVTHNLDDAIRYGDRLIMLHKGSIVQDLGAEKKKQLTIPELLALFHGYEDKILLESEYQNEEILS